jgi:hypothetical protein
MKLIKYVITVYWHLYNWDQRWYLMAIEYNFVKKEVLKA